MHLNSWGKLPHPLRDFPFLPVVTGCWNEREELSLLLDQVTAVCRTGYSWCLVKRRIPGPLSWKFGFSSSEVQPGNHIVNKCRWTPMPRHTWETPFSSVCVSCLSPRMSCFTFTFYLPGIQRMKFLTYETQKCLLRLRWCLCKRLNSPRHEIYIQMPMMMIITVGMYVLDSYFMF